MSLNETNKNFTTGQVMAAARARGLIAGKRLAVDGVPIVCHGGKPLEVFCFLHGAAEGHSLAMAAEFENKMRNQAT